MSDTPSTPIRVVGRQTDKTSPTEGTPNKKKVVHGLTLIDDDDQSEEENHRVAVTKEEDLQERRLCCSRSYDIENSTDHALLFRLLSSAVWKMWKCRCVEMSVCGVASIDCQRADPYQIHSHDILVGSYQQDKFRCGLGQDAYAAGGKSFCGGRSGTRSGRPLARVHRSWARGCAKVLQKE
jgi:hypothetical protein